MSTPLPNRFRQTLLVAGCAIGLGTVFFVYVWLRIEPRVFCYREPPLFLSDARFLVSFVNHPGGLVIYASTFLSPLLAYDWIGALVITVLTGLICVAARGVIAAVGSSRGNALCLVPAAIMLLLLGQYVHPAAISVGLLSVLLFTNAHVALAARIPVVKLPAFVLICAGLYWATAGICLLFAILAGIVEWRARQRRVLGAVCMLCGLALPAAIGMWACDLSVGGAFAGLLPAEADSTWLTAPSWVEQWFGKTYPALYLWILVAVHTLLLACVPVIGLAARKKHGRQGTAWTVVCVLVIAIAAILLVNDNKRRLLAFMYCVENREWPDAIQRASRISTQQRSVVVSHHVCRALFHTDRLLDEMFAYPQSQPAPTLLLDEPGFLRSAPLERSDILFELGRINESEHMASEALEVVGDRARILKRLVRIQVLKGEPAAARVFLTFLARSLWHAGWARRCLDELDSDPQLSSDHEVASRRAMMITIDHVGEMTEELTFQQLLDRNRHNRMALEYLIAHYLLTRQLDKVMDMMPNLSELYTDRIPRHCQEAIVLWMEITGQDQPDMGELWVDAGVTAQYREFIAALARHGPDRRSAQAALRPANGDTYFYYYTFGSTGGRRSGHVR